MKTTTIATLATAAALSLNASARASDFDGAYLTVKGGMDHTKASGAYQADKKNVGSTGLETGYRRDIGHDVLVGADVFYDYNARASHDTADGGSTKYGSNVFGSDFLVGTVFDSKTFVYGKLGGAHVKGIEGERDFTHNAMHYGLGVSYAIAPRMNVGVEYTDARAKEHGSRLNNDNVMFTASYQFGKLLR
jgi:opacity protein-like surface antigen